MENGGGKVVSIEANGVNTALPPSQAVMPKQTIDI